MRLQEYCVSAINSFRLPADNFHYSMKTLICLLAMLALTARSAPSTGETNLLLFIHSSDKTRFVFEIPRDKAKAQPPWDPETGAVPPLRVTLACATAKRALQLRYDTNLEFGIREIALRPMTGFGTWYYDIECNSRDLLGGSEMHAVILMDVSDLEPTIVRTSDFSSIYRQAKLDSFSLDQKIARARMGDAEALSGIFAFSTRFDATKTPEFGTLLTETVAYLGDANVAKVATAQPAEVKASVLGHLDAGAAHEDVTSLQHPVVEAFPLTYKALAMDHPSHSQ